MNILNYISRKKEEFQQARKEKAALKAVYEKNPDIEIKDLQEQKKVLEMRAQAGKLREDIAQQKRELSPIYKAITSIRGIRIQETTAQVGKKGVTVKAKKGGERPTLFGGFEKAEPGSAFKGGGVFGR